MLDVADCQYEVIQAEIHRFILQPSKRAIEEHFTIMHHLLNDHPAEQTFRLLFILHDADRLPGMYTVNQATRFWSDHRPRFPIRAAYLHDGNFILQIYEQFAKTLRLNSSREFFTVDHMDHAIEWLLAE